MNNINKKYNLKYQIDNIPNIFINGNTQNIKEYVFAKMEYISKSKHFLSYIKIKYQGDFSLYYPKKNLIVKMYSDIERTKELKKCFKDWKTESNEYVLKANYIDHSHARNIISANLWTDVVNSRNDYSSLPKELRDSPKNGAIDGFPVKLYLNEVYQGIYTFNIGKGSHIWNMDEYNPNHILLSAEINTNGKYRETSCNFRKLYDGCNEWNIIVGTNNDKVKYSLNKLITYVKDTNDKIFKLTIVNYLDIQSAIDYYIHQYVICGLDNLSKNMSLATYDLKKWYCGVYDMDATFGLYYTGNLFVSPQYPCPEKYEERYSLLWERIESVFINELKQRYFDLRKSIYTYDNIIFRFENFMNSIGYDLYNQDLIIYHDIPSKNSNNIEQIRNYTHDRLIYCDEQFSNM